MADNYKKIKFDRKNTIFSLYGSRMKEIKFHNKALKLKVDRIFESTGNEEQTYSGEICFKDCDLKLCSVMIFNKTLGKGHFTGNALYLEDFMDEYKDAELEIITESYFNNTSNYTGWLWRGEKNPVSFIMYIWNSGDMEYCIEPDEDFRQ